jgi:hypothetical protein
LEVKMKGLAIVAALLVGGASLAMASLAMAQSRELTADKTGGCILTGEGLTDLLTGEQEFPPDCKG